MFVIVAVDTEHKFTTDVIDTGDKLMTGVNDTGDKRKNLCMIYHKCCDQSLQMNISGFLLKYLKKSFLHN